MFHALIEKRRSIRRFQPKAVEPEKIDLLTEAALRAPSSMGRNPWSFVVIRKRDLLEALSRAKPHGASFLKNAPLGIVVCADPTESDVWVEDCSIACTFLFLAAESLGLGACWIQIRDRMHDRERSAEGYVREVLGIPEHLKVEAFIAVGYPAEQKPPHGKEELQEEKVFYEAYGNRNS
ncbi:MAG: nitroreductase family protein [Deltaproteobacteria bacterium]|nr:nitroreductase family protein [Deltaproteobacteria bacterium]